MELCALLSIPQTALSSLDFLITAAGNEDRESLVSADEGLVLLISAIEILFSV